ncbi:hypothetical protein C7441_1115 [Pseudaminobacter salicylatoxidans]|uniref:YncI copper-binding domain-containing protein n=1 Tax=Pseudaminobacter salicylatoxidans TaxID=93369 RepID=A0A316C1B5_PSESE|nr:DUF1775 domain-containing protein [Pseudaminobacter salicylatoxidans]PWJ80885.1 hypothetical protein C7441_1115 [Pseudaminobacter salicylatoxidans]
MRRILFPFAAACALSAASIVAAHAHATLEKSEAAPGSYKAVLKIPHGCDGGQATHTVRLEIPEGYIGAKPMPKAGWELAVEKGDYAKTYKLHGEEVKSGVMVVTWSGGNLPDDFYDEFAVSGTLADVEEGQQLFFKATQVCDKGEVAWNEEPAAGQNPHSLEHPAPAVTILAASAGGHDHAGHGGHEAAPVKAGDLEISGAWARAMLPGQPTGGAYLTIANKGKAADKLVGATSPNAGKVEVHTMEVKDDVMVMRSVEGGLEIPAGETVELKPGGFHVMFMGVKEAFKEGATVPVTLEFEHAGKVDMQVPVKAANGGDDHSGHEHSDH